MSDERVIAYSPWNQNAESGDIMVRTDGRVYRLYERKDAKIGGTLYMREIKKEGCKGVIKDGVLVWIKKLSEES